MSQTPSILSIRDLDFWEKPLFLRLDLNVPLAEPDAEGHRRVADDTRIVEALPTIRLALEKKAKLIIASHLGRPKGKPSPEFSLEPVAEHLSALLELPVTLADDCVGDGIELMIKRMKPGEVLMLENLRFHGEEEANTTEFCNQLARLADTYVNDAFGTAHRKHASTFGLPVLTSNRGAGLLIEKELKYLDLLLNDPAQPFWLVLGGAKVADKIKTIHSLLRHVDGIVIGGAMAYAFMEARGQKIPTGALAPTEEGVLAAKSILRDADRRNVSVVLPVDFKDSMDIGPETIKKFESALAPAKTLFWNGPVGCFEKPEYAQGTLQLAEYVSKLSALKIVGGGDTIAAIHQSGFSSGFDHLSTGGGAVLKYLEGAGLPGIDVLRSKRKTQSPTLTPV